MAEHTTHHIVPKSTYYLIFLALMWRVHGKPAPPRPGYVANPYTMADAEQRLAEVSGDAAFAKQFFDRYIHGRDALDYEALLAPAGFALQKVNAGRAWWGDLRLDTRGGVVIAAPPAANTPVYKAGLDIGDEIRSLDGTKMAVPDDVAAMLRRHKPGDTIAVEYVDRTGSEKAVQVTLGEDPAFALVTIESTGRTPTAAQVAFRNAWLGRKG